MKNPLDCHLKKPGACRPQKFLFRELIKSRPFCGTKQHWRDAVNNDLKILDVLPPKDWYAFKWIDNNSISISYTLEDVHKLWIPSTQVYNVLVELSTMDVAVPFTIKIQFIIYTIVMDNPKLSEIILNVPVDKLSIHRTTSHSIQSTASRTFCP